MKTRIIPVVTLGLAGIAMSLFGSGCAATTGKSTGEYLTDAAITTKVKAKLIKDPVVKAREINVDTNNGVVSLNGTVDTQEQKMRADEIARGTSGIQGVQDNLFVRGTAER